ncbi:MAG: integrase [Deltaproteobacteria bacterium HGW-Deltaproteobacteria-15]|nr:MAG: integrase [Deltaproteobacteria bacterium HGW-Deltaproteobacteria-15]
MKKSKNPNHPAAGSTIKVEPIKTTKDIKSIKKMLAGNPRDLALFTMGINTNLRASDLLAIKAGMVRGLKPMDEIELREKKTGKVRRISLNRACIEAVQALLASRPYQDGDFLFRSQRGEVLAVPSLHRLVKGWCRDINLKGNFGSHTLRKTWGYHQRVTFGIGLPELMVCFNHSTQRQTLEYLCIQPEEVRSVYANEL